MALTVDSTMVKALKKGTVLTVKATVDSAQETAFTIPLKGFASAVDRTATLSK